MKATLVLAAICATLLAGCKTTAPSKSLAVVPVPRETEPGHYVIYAPDGSCKITIDTTQATNLTVWAEQKLAPVLAQWYPKISAMLPSPGYTPPTNWSVIIAPGNGVAATGGTRVTANATWFEGELDKQGVGALVHEEVHVVQQYGGGRRNYAPGNFSNGDITNIASLANKLKDAADPVSAFVRRQLTSAERKALADYRGPGPKAYILRTNLVAALNRIVRGPAIYDAALFTNVTLRDSTATLREGNPEGRDLARLNRALLEDAYPGELARTGGGGRNRSNTDWLTEGIPDYIRWFIYEPQSHGADFVYFKRLSDSAAKRGHAYSPKYDGLYRPSAYFLYFVSEKYDRHLVAKLNDALRQGRYYDDIWADITGKTLPQLNEEWLAMFHKQAETSPAASATPTKN